MAQCLMFSFAALLILTAVQMLQRGKGGNYSVRLDSDRVIIRVYENTGGADCAAE